jgi:hypothetical protein
MEEDRNHHNQAFYNAVRAGDESSSQGTAKPYTNETMKAIKAKARQNLDSGDLIQSAEALPL